MRYVLIFSFVFLFPASSYAKGIDNQSHLRTLFTSLYVRNQLDKQRAQGKFDNIPQNSASPIFREPVTVKMQGVVIRQDKKPVVFVNDGNTLNSRAVNSEITVNTKRVNEKAYKVPVKINQSHIKLKPGQQWNESDHKVQDNYQIKPSKPETDDNEKSSISLDNLNVIGP